MQPLLHPALHNPPPYAIERLITNPSLALADFRAQTAPSPEKATGLMR